MLVILSPLLLRLLLVCGAHISLLFDSPILMSVLNRCRVHLSCCAATLFLFFFVFLNHLWFTINFPKLNPKRRELVPRYIVLFIISLPAKHRTQMSGGTLFIILEGTLQADKQVRQQAELSLEELSKQQPDFVVELIRFCTQPVDPTVAASNASKVLLAAAIRVRNLLGRSDWNRSGTFTEAVKNGVKDIIIPLQCAPHVEEHIRRQLLSTTSELLQYDYPKRWEQAVPQVSQILESAMVNLLALPSHTDADDQATLALLLQIKGGMGVLRYCCKELNQFATTIIPSILSLWEFLLPRWEQEVRRVHDAEQRSPVDPGSKDLLEPSPMLAELSHCLRLCLKCLWSLCANRWPKVLCDEELFSRFFGSCLQRPTEILLSGLCPVFRIRIARNVDHTMWYGDRFQDFQEASVWRLAKWCGTLMHKLVQDFSFPKQCEKRARPVAKLFCAQYLPYVALYSLDLVRWHAAPVSLNSKAHIMALECLSFVIAEPSCYTAVLLPAAEELMTALLFTRFAFSSDDAELWNLNPEEYVRKQTSPAGDLFNPKVVSASLLVSLAVPTKPFHDASLLRKLMDFIVNQLSTFSAQASQTAPGEPASPEMEPARRVDAAMYCLYHLKKVVRKMDGVSSSLEGVLLRYVVPATSYPIGFLRARAVQVLSVYSSIVQWSTSQNFQQALLAVIPLLRDSEAPVQVQTCVSFSLLIHHPYAWEVINPCIADVVQQYFNVMRMIDNEAVVRTLQKTIHLYSNSLCQWAVELTDMITQHFFKVAETVTGKYVSFEGTPGSTEAFTEDDNFVDVLMTADELLETLTVLIRSIPETPAEDAAGTNHAHTVLLQIQERVAPLLQTILGYQSGSAYGFMDPALRLLTTLLSRSPSIVPGIWRLLPCLHQLVVSGAADYFGQMLAPLDNYSSVEPIRFVLSPFHELFADTSCFNDSSMMQWTPAQLVLHMADLVFQSPTLRLREKSSVPKVCDAFLQNYWWATTQQPEAVPPHAAASLAGVVTTSAVLRLSALSTPSSTMKVLLANSVFAAMLADVKGTAMALHAQNMLPSFFQEYCSLVSQPSTLELLRRYDRRLVAAAVAEALRSVQEWRAGPPDHGEALDALEAALQMIVESQMLQCFAHRDGEEIRQEMEELQKHLGSGAARDGDEEWESEGSDSDAGEWTDGEWGDEELPSEDEAAVDDAGGKLSRLIQEAQAARQGAKGPHEEDPNDDLEDADDNLLDEEDMESPVLDKLNVWMALAEVGLEGQAVSPAAAALLDPRLKGQWDDIVLAKDSLQAWSTMKPNTSASHGQLFSIHLYDSMRQPHNGEAAPQTTGFVVVVEIRIFLNLQGGDVAMGFSAWLGVVGTTAIILFCSASMLMNTFVVLVKHEPTVGVLVMLLFAVTWVAGAASFVAAIANDCGPLPACLSATSVEQLTREELLKYAARDHESSEEQREGTMTPEPDDDVNANELDAQRFAERAQEGSDLPETEEGPVALLQDDGSARPSPSSPDHPDAVEERRRRKQRMGLEVITVPRLALNILKAMDEGGESKRRELSRLFHTVELCPFCQVYMLQGTLHCRFCDRCVPFMCHHCCSIGQCIGFGNHKFYILFLFYFLAAAALSVPTSIVVLWKGWNFFVEPMRQNIFYYYGFYFTTVFLIMFSIYFTRHVYVVGCGESLVRQMKRDDYRARAEQRRESHSAIFQRVGETEEIITKESFDWGNVRRVFGDENSFIKYLLPAQRRSNYRFDEAARAELKDLITTRLHALADVGDTTNNNEEIRSLSGSACVVQTSPRSDFLFWFFQLHYENTLRDEGINNTCSHSRLCQGPIVIRDTDLSNLSQLGQAGTLISQDSNLEYLSHISLFSPFSPVDFRVIPPLSIYVPGRIRAFRSEKGNFTVPDLFLYFT
eukprot:gene4296-3112_t